MRIGIITFWWSNDNYGQLLQCYALQKFLKDKGHEPFLIRYKAQRKSILCYLYKAVNISFSVKWLINRLKNKNEQKKHNRHFDDFRKQYLKMSETSYSTIDELRRIPPEADAYIVGSDQVWNTFNNNIKSIKKRIQVYFLDFGKVETKRLSYAASWGVEEISDNYKREISPLLQNFNYVSVREETGINICKQCGINDVEWVCDPTLLLSADSYRKLYRNEKIGVPKEKFLFLYLLKNPCELNMEEVFSFAKKKNLKVIYVTGNGRIDTYEKSYVSIQEWLALIDKAEYVITNSFHCAVFSIIFHKAFAVSRIIGKNCQNNNRFKSLFQMTRTGCRFLINNDFTILSNHYSPSFIPVSQKFLNILSE